MGYLTWPAAFLVLSGGLFTGWITGQWHWLARSGALVVVLGILLTSSQLLEHMRRLRVRRHFPGDNPSRHDWADADEKRRLDHSREREESISRSEWSGFMLLIVGTVVWGFGDLVGGV